MKLSKRIKRIFSIVLYKVRGYAPRELLINAGDSILQIGVPKKRSVERILRCIGPKGFAVIVEVEKANIEMIEQSIGRFVKNVHLIKKGVWKEKATGELYIGRRSGDHRLVIEGIEHDND